MPIFAIFGLFFGVIFWAGVATVILRLVFKGANPRLLNTISLAAPILMLLPLGIDESFVVSVLLTIPAWFLLEYFDRQERERKRKKAGQATPNTGSD
ncbi:MAG: hypothetical protein M3Q03_08085 [Chloroflexota bacterium]|nr:hypothetical protein [Chloroflexota bacterium]